MSARLSLVSHLLNKRVIDVEDLSDESAIHLVIKFEDDERIDLRKTEPCRGRGGEVTFSLNKTPLVSTA